MISLSNKFHSNPTQSTFTIIVTVEKFIIVMVKKVLEATLNVDMCFFHKGELHLEPKFSVFCALS